MTMRLQTSRFRQNLHKDSSWWESISAKALELNYKVKPLTHVPVSTSAGAATQWHQSRLLRRSNSCRPWNHIWNIQSSTTAKLLGTLDLLDFLKIFFLGGDKSPLSPGAKIMQLKTCWGKIGRVMSLIWKQMSTRWTFLARQHVYNPVARGWN